MVLTPKPRRRPPAQVVLTSVDERRFQTMVLKLAHFWDVCGFHVSFSHGAVMGVHTLGAGDDHYDSNGWPDWVFITADDRMLYRELKRKGAYLTPEQKRWHARLEAAGQDVGVWRPGDEALVVEAFRPHSRGVT